MRRVFVACLVVVNAFFLSTYFRFQLPASLHRADVAQRNIFSPSGFLHFFPLCYNYSLSAFLFTAQFRMQSRMRVSLHFVIIIRELPETAWAAIWP